MKPTCNTTYAATIMILALCLAAQPQNTAAASTFLRGAGGRRDLSVSFREETRMGGSTMGTNNVVDPTPRLQIPADQEEEVTPEEGGSCPLLVTLTCPVPDKLTLNNDCIDPFRTMTFRYNGGDCSQSDALLDRQDFKCTDYPPTTTVPEGTDEHYIVVKSQAGGQTYFEGPVKVGDEYTLNANEEYDVLSGIMTIGVYESKEGNKLQDTNVLLDCSNPLFLFDKFGSSQVTSWSETSGRVVTSNVDTKRTGSVGVAVENTDPTTSITLSEMTLLANTQDEPISYTDEVRNSVLAPEGTLELSPVVFEYDLLTRTRYTFLTTVIAEGDQCNSSAMIECIL